MNCTRRLGSNPRPATPGPHPDRRRRATDFRESAAGLGGLMQAACRRVVPEIRPRTDVGTSAGLSSAEIRSFSARTPAGARSPTTGCRRAALIGHEQIQIGADRLRRARGDCRPRACRARAAGTETERPGGRAAACPRGAAADCLACRPECAGADQPAGTDRAAGTPARCGARRPGERARIGSRRAGPVAPAIGARQRRPRAAAMPQPAKQ
jgi:hypothetical protein